MTIRTVLICDDHIPSRKLFAALLDHLGCRHLEAVDGREALTLARAHRPDLIMLDISLPEISGPEVVTALRGDAELSRIPIIAVTAHVMRGDAERFLAMGFDAYLAKPIAVPLFLAMTNSFLATAGTAAG